jgi:hypothetical protein
LSPNLNAHGVNVIWDIRYSARNAAMHAGTLSVPMISAKIVSI